MLRYLLEKEFKQFMRNRFLPRIVIILPFAALAIFPLTANMDIKNLALAVVDNDHSAASRQIGKKITSSGFFRLRGYFDNSSAALKSVERNDADLILEIPPRFEQSLNRENAASVMIAANAVNGMKGGMGSMYLSSIIADYNREFAAGRANETGITAPAMEIRPLYRFNPDLSYRAFMVPALMSMMLAVICGFLPALNIVSEKENGTIEQMNVTPVGKFTFIISKLIPYWTAGVVVAALCMFTAFIFYGMLPKGSIPLLYLFVAVYILSFSGFGLIVSNYAQSIQQAIFIIFFFVLTMIFLSGLYTPYQNMPGWAQFMSNASPLKYFIQVLRITYLKGAAFAEMRHLFYPLCILAVIFNGWAVLSYEQRGG